MKKTIHLSVLALLCLNYGLKAQTLRRLQGTVYDAATRHALGGASIQLKGSKATATISDSAGRFSLFTSADTGRLSISYIGYRHAEVSFQLSRQNSYAIYLAEDKNELKEVRVLATGYRYIPQSRATGSFAQPNEAMYEARVATDALSKLSGITSGLLFNANTSNSQSGQLDISIRGRSTIFANDQPLIVVDNFPYTGDIAAINPNDIASVTVLKDAATASIWGVRAGNGVIVLTTKKGKLAQPLKIAFSASWSSYAQPRLNYNPNQLGAAAYIDLEQYLFNQGYDDANLANTTTYPAISPVVTLLAAQRAGTLTENELNTALATLRKNNSNAQILHYFYQKANHAQYALNLSGGSAKSSYYCALGYDDDALSLKDNNYQRISLTSQNTFTPISQLALTTGIYLSMSQNQIDHTLSQFSAQVFPYTELADAKGAALPITMNYNTSYIQNAMANGLLDWSYYPLKELGKANNMNTQLQLRLNEGITYTLAKGLKAAIYYQYQNSQGQNKGDESQQSYYTRNLINTYTTLDASGKPIGYPIPLGDILNLGQAATISHQLRAQLSYQLDWKQHTP